MKLYYFEIYLNRQLLLRATRTHTDIHGLTRTLR